MDVANIGRTPSYNLLCFPHAQFDHQKHTYTDPSMMGTSWTAYFQISKAFFVCVEAN